MGGVPVGVEKSLPHRRLSEINIVPLGLLYRKKLFFRFIVTAAVQMNMLSDVTDIMREHDPSIGNTNYSHVSKDKRQTFCVQYKKTEPSSPLETKCYRFPL